MSRFWKNISSLRYIEFGKRYLKKMSEMAAAVLESASKRVAEDDLTETVETKRKCVERVRKRKVAIMLSYSGQGYFGMQRNRGTRTIEEDLLVAFMKIGAINEEAFETPQCVAFQRAARTDKGVSAARQVISLKLPDDCKIESVNENLPEQIRVMSIKRVTKGFNSKSSCDSRTYSYMLPSFAFASESKEHDAMYRIQDETLERVSSVFKKYEGTHNFHNFTSRKKPLDPSAQRFIIKCSMSQPFVVKDSEFIILKVKGQSFMLHQIRKMVGLLIAVVKGLTNEECIDKAFQENRLDIPMAPGLGLVLEEVHYDRYNMKYGRDGIHEALDWQEVWNEVELFKKNYIQSEIINTEIMEKPMISWLETLELHTYDVREHHKDESQVVDDDFMNDLNDKEESEENCRKIRKEKFSFISNETS